MKVLAVDDIGIEHDLSIRLHAELEHISGPRPHWSGGENTMDQSKLETPRSRGPLWLVAAAIVLVAGAALVISQQPNTAGAGPSPSPSPALSAHQVATDQGIVSFAIEDGAIVVRLEAGGTTTELGRTSTSANATSGFAMVCGPADGPDSHRYVFGNLGIGDPIIYQGPPADGQGAPDGTFLFALRPGTIGTTGTIQSQPGHPALMVEVELVSGSRVRSLVGFPGGAWADAISTGQRQTSGCFVLD